MSVYLLFAVLLMGDEYQVGVYPTFEECDVVSTKLLEENKEIFSVRCVLDEQVK